MNDDVISNPDELIPSIDPDSFGPSSLSASTIFTSTSAFHKPGKRNGKSIGRDDETRVGIVGKAKFRRSGQGRSEIGWAFSSFFLLNDDPGDYNVDTHFTCIAYHGRHRLSYPKSGCGPQLANIDAKEQRCRGEAKKKSSQGKVRRDSLIDLSV